MSAALRPSTWRAARYRRIGRLTENEFDTLELVAILGGCVTVGMLAARWELKHDTVGRRMQRMVKAGLFEQEYELVEARRRGVRIVHYTISETGHAMFREALAAMDAACEEAA